jgi:hypothetical protein
MTNEGRRQKDESKMMRDVRRAAVALPSSEGSDAGFYAIAY